MGWSTNEKALEKREKEATKKKQAQIEKQQAREAQKWKDQVTEKKKQTAQQKEQRRLKELERKQQLKALAEMQQKQLEKQNANKKTKGEFNEPKVTQAELKRRQEQALLEKLEKTYKNEQEQFFQEENPNKKFEGYEVSNTVEGALQILQEGIEKHPQKRYKAAFEAYAQKREKEIKIDYPKFKRSKRIDMMRKQFEKHPDNPYNKKNLKQYNYSRKKEEKEEEGKKEEQEN